MSGDRASRVGDSHRLRRNIGLSFAGVLVALVVVGCGGSPSATNPPSVTRTVLPTTAMPSAIASASPQLVSPTATLTVAAALGHGEFGPTGAMTVVRNGQTATLLLDGRVLIAGGSRDNSAELYHPQTGTFSPTGPMRRPGAWPHGYPSAGRASPHRRGLRNLVRHRHRRRTVRPDDRPVRPNGVAGTRSQRPHCHPSAGRTRPHRRGHWDGGL